MRIGKTPIKASAPDSFVHTTLKPCMSVSASFPLYRLVYNYLLLE